MSKKNDSKFDKGDLLMFNGGNGNYMHLLVVHVVEPNEIYYCWDRKNETYRLVYDQPGLTMLCPEFDLNFTAEINWSDRWMVDLYVKKYKLKNGLPTKKQFTDDLVGISKNFT